MPKEALDKIGEKIWYNECAHSIEGLTHWKEGENFASLGIGHFIWYPCDHPKIFQETFPNLICFLKDHHVLLPYWLEQTLTCPWNCREEFYADFHSSTMQDLRDLLFETRHLQTLFILERLESSLTTILDILPSHSQEHICSLFLRLKEDQQGLYALVDYVNFKGLGTHPSETYQGKGWGLLQVLQNMSAEPKNLIFEFVETAKQILIQRVLNAPAERQEEKWLKGWLNRLDTYLESF